MLHFRKCSFFFVGAILLFYTCLYGSTIDEGEDIEEKDVQALREWLNTKRQVTVRQLGGALSVSGEIRPNFQKTAETVNGIKQRGMGGASSLPTDAYGIEVNLFLDYRANRSWSAIKLEFDNDAGIQSGTFNKLRVEKAYFGIFAVQNDTSTLSIQVGRDRMSWFVDSRIQFSSFFDGIWLRYDQNLESIADFYIHAGPYLINSATNHYGYLGEIGLINIIGTGIYAKYSINDWDTKDFTDPITRDRYRFIVNQLTLGYRFWPASLQKAVVIHLAGLYNPAAKKLPITDFKRANWGGYINLAMGELKKQWDWTLHFNYQFLQAQCVPDFNANTGIGMGNAKKTGFYATNGIPNTRATAGGNVNYRGYYIVFNWLLLDQLTLSQTWQQSITLDHDIGPSRRYKQYALQLLYVW
jgi:hypothetical protein